MLCSLKNLNLLHRNFTCPEVGGPPTWQLSVTGRPSQSRRKLAEIWPMEEPNASSLGQRLAEGVSSEGSLHARDPCYGPREEGRKEKAEEEATPSSSGPMASRPISACTIQCPSWHMRLCNVHICNVHLQWQTSGWLPGLAGICPHCWDAVRQMGSGH